jgi:hypothetical protein
MIHHFELLLVPVLRTIPNYAICVRSTLGDDKRIIPILYRRISKNYCVCYFMFFALRVLLFLHRRCCGLLNDSPLGANRNIPICCFVDFCVFCVLWNDSVGCWEDGMEWHGMDRMIPPLTVVRRNFGGLQERHLEWDQKVYGCRVRLFTLCSPICKGELRVQAGWQSARKSSMIKTIDKRSTLIPIILAILSQV